MKIFQKGFTLIELMVTTAIMVILVSVFLANFSGNSVTRNLNNARNNLVSDLRKAQSNSLSSLDITPGTPSSDYGITLNLGTNNQYKYVGDDNSVTPQRTVFSTATLPLHVYVSQISIVRADGSSTTATNMEVLFKNPFARVLQNYSGGSITGTDDTNAITTITIKTTDSASASQTVTVNGITGSIY